MWCAAAQSREGIVRGTLHKNLGKESPLERSQVNRYSDSQKGNGRQNDPQPEFRCPTNPFRITDDRESQANEEDRVGGISKIREAITEDIGEHGSLASNSDQIGKRKNDGHHQEGFGRTRGDEKFDPQCKYIDNQRGRERAQLCKWFGRGMQNSVGNPAAIDDVTDAGCHENQRDGGSKSTQTFDQAAPNRL